jgi:hypothetical protein
MREERFRGWRIRGEYGRRGGRASEALRAAPNTTRLRAGLPQPPQADTAPSLPRLDEATAQVQQAEQPGAREAEDTPLQLPR